MRLWIVTTSTKYGTSAVEVVRAASAYEAETLTHPWAHETVTVEPLTYEGHSGVLVSDDR